MLKNIPHTEKQKTKNTKSTIQITLRFICKGSSNIFNLRGVRNAIREHVSSIRQNIQWWSEGNRVEQVMCVKGQHVQYAYREKKIFSKCL